MSLEIYTDGSCWPNDGTGNGTFGFIVVENDVLLNSFTDGRRKTTNNKMELMGLITALKYIIPKIDTLSKVIIYSDSQYVVNGYNIWSLSWFGENGKEDLKNRELWEYLHNLRHEKIKVIWVKGHANTKWNNHIDALCTEEFKLRYNNSSVI